MSGCTHTSAWHKEHVRCISCGAPYDVLEQMMLGNEHRGFSIEQEKTIARMTLEAIEDAE